MIDSASYRSVWRWHFYAGLFVLPFVIVLSLSGSIFLFKPQIDRWEERRFHGLGTEAAIAPSRQAAVALEGFPGARLYGYRLPERPGDATLVQLMLTNGDLRDVFVSSQGRLLGSIDTDRRVTALVQRLHGQLLLGRRGSWLVELAASWAIVMIATGMYLWWPRGRGAAGVLWPRRRSLLRDLHSVTGFWIASFALVLLLTGLPWADVWGNAFLSVRQQMGWVKGTPDWTIGGEDPAIADVHSVHDGAMHSDDEAVVDLAVLDRLVPAAASEQLAFPVQVLAPAALPGDARSAYWHVKSAAQNRTLGREITYDGSGTEISREDFADQHPIDRVVGYGISWHEGQLFGWINQLIGVLTALALTLMSITGFLQWRRRRPIGQLGAPALPSDPRKSAGMAVVILALAVVLPLLAASLLLLWLFDRLLPRLSPAAAVWLGIQRAHRAPARSAGDSG